jgi:hypothetical protein
MRSELQRLFLTTTLLLAAACGGGEGVDAGALPDAAPPSADATLPDAGAPDTGAADAAPLDSGTPAPVDAGQAPDAAPVDGGSPADNPDCDPLDEAVCAFPWPSNLYLVEDAARATGYTLSFGRTSLPANVAGAHIEPDAFRRLDGYGLGTPIMVMFPDLDPAQLPDEEHIADSLAEDAKILLFRDFGKGMQRVPYFAELDGHEPDPAKKVLFIRPAVILDEGARYVVAIRDLVDRSGRAFAPSRAFANLRSGQTTADSRLAPRQARFDAIFTQLEAEGLERDSLLLAWDFVTASSDALHGWLVHMRDDALATVGPSGPALTFTDIVAYQPEPTPQNLPVDAQMAFRVEGELTVPSYLTTRDLNFFSSTVLQLGDDGLPERTGTRRMKFWMMIPHSVVNGQAGLVQYGHGLLGSGAQTVSGHNRQLGFDHNLIFFGSNWTGFDEDMELAVGIAVRDLTGFVWVADTLHQGIVEFAILARAIRERLPTDPFLLQHGITIEPGALWYSGISQGGIFGATYMALSTDITRGHLGVPGNNYSTLLHRSVDFVPFFEMLQEAYPRSDDQAVLLAAVQLLWDQTDPVSYYRRISANPLPGTPSHQVLLAPAKGDWQVAVATCELAARSATDIVTLEPYDAERTPFGLRTAPYPHQGSGMVLWDFGNPWPAPGNLPPNDALGDPHGRPRRLASHSRQMVHFFRTGEIIDVCGGDGCRPE